MNPPTLIVIALVTISLLLLGGVVVFRLRRSLGAQHAATERMRREVHRLRAGLADQSATAAESRPLAAQLSALRGEDIRQIEALLDIRSLIDPRTTMPSTQGWAATPMTISRLLAAVLETRPPLVVECGSGGSSVWVGYALERLGGGRCVALEHDADYAEKTRADIRRHGLEDYVEVRDAPLVEQRIGGESFPWYDPAACADLADIGLVFVDGPPGDTGPLARFPALPLLRERCRPGALFLLDDAGRPDEKGALNRWGKDYGAITVDKEAANTGWHLVSVR